MKIKPIQLTKILATNRNGEVDIRFSKEYVTNGEWLLKEDYINVGKITVKTSDFWESRQRELSKHDRDFIVEIPIPKVNLNLKTPKGLDVVKFTLTAPNKVFFDCYIQQVYYDKLVLPLLKNEEVTLETSCPKMYTVADPFDPKPYANKILIKHKGDFIGCIMPIYIEE